MSWKLTCLISLVSVLALAHGASALVVKSGETVTYNARTRIPDGNTVVEAGGTLIFKARLDFDGGDELHIYGTVISENTCKFPDSSGSQHVKAFIYNGGLWDAQDLENRAGGEVAAGGGRGDWIKLFLGSTLIVRTRYGSGHQFYDPSFWIRDGSLIPGEEGEEISFEELDGGAVRITNGRPQAMPYARSPNPADGAMHFDTWVNLSWKPGDFAVSHDVYLGDSLGSVEQATRDSEVFRGNQTATFYVAGFPGYAYPDGLVPGTTYYWRIDEVNDAEPNSPWKGDIWRFSIPPRTAYNPVPADGAEFVALNAKLTWTAGFGAKLHTIYFGDNFETVSNATGGLPQGTTTYTPSALQAEKVYYWRVDEFDAAATHKGNVWAFTTPGAAGNPQPANRAAGVQMVAKLSWTPATNATSHQVYFGTDKDAVRNATTASPEYKGSKALGDETLDPGKLAWHSDYCWRVDAVYTTSTVKGLVWSFTTADFLLVDDFESYNDIDPPDPASNRIFDAWIDGFADPATNGALVGNDLPPYAEQTIVHGGAQSMPYRYDNANKTSEATLTLVYPRDWTEEGVGQLSLWFRGASANSAERMYVALNGGTPVYHTDAKVTQTGRWTRWVIDLQAFQGVTLTNVNTITLGLGTKGSPAAGGAGKMYFDDIRLYRP